MIDFDIRKYNDEEIKQMISMLTSEQTIRTTAKREKAWDNVKKAILEYTSEFGTITISDYESTIYIDKTCSFSTCGNISNITPKW